MNVYRQNITAPRPPYLGGDNWSLQDLTPITILFGKNSSGKSLLLRAWRDQDVDNTHYVTPERGGEINYDPGQIQHQQNAQGRRGQTSTNLATNYRQQVVARITAYFATRGDYRGKGEMPGDPSELERFIGLLIPDFTVSISAKSTPPYRLTRAINEQRVENVQQLSSGEAQILTLAMDVITIAAIWDIEDHPTRILLLDEPDAHIHPDLQVRFADFLLRVATRFKVQVAVATHSTTLLAALGQFGAADTSVIYLDRRQQDFRARRFDDVTKEMAACLGGHLLMGPLFGAPLLLVEGDDDYRIWSQIPRHHIVNLAVIPSHGDEIRKYQRTLERILASLVEPGKRPLGYALLDGDKSLPRPNPDNPQSYVQYIQLACHEAENLYLSDEVLADMDLSWDEAVSRIEQGAADYGNKREQLAGARAWNRESEDLKEVINEVSQIIDPKNVHWTFRIGHVLGRSWPSGQIANFLGEAVVEALWGKEPENERGTEPAA